MYGKIDNLGLGYETLSIANIAGQKNVLDTKAPNPSRSRYYTTRHTARTKAADPPVYAQHESFSFLLAVYSTMLRGYQSLFFFFYMR